MSNQHTGMQSNASKQWAFYNQFVLNNNTQHILMPQSNPSRDAPFMMQNDGVGYPQTAIPQRLQMMPHDIHIGQHLPSGYPLMMDSFVMQQNGAAHQSPNIGTSFSQNTPTFYPHLSSQTTITNPPFAYMPAFTSPYILPTTSRLPAHLVYPTQQTSFSLPQSLPVMSSSTAPVTTIQPSTIFKRIDYPNTATTELIEELSLVQQTSTSTGDGAQDSVKEELTNDSDNTPPRITEVYTTEKADDCIKYPEEAETAVKPQRKRRVGRPSKKRAKVDQEEEEGAVVKEEGIAGTKGAPGKEETAAVNEEVTATKEEGALVKEEGIAGTKEGVAVEEEDTKKVKVQSTNENGAHVKRGRKKKDSTPDVKHEKVEDEEPPTVEEPTTEVVRGKRGASVQAREKVQSQLLPRKSSRSNKAGKVGTPKEAEPVEAEKTPRKRRSRNTGNDNDDEQQKCFLCGETLTGDLDEINSHIDSCLASSNASPKEKGKRKTRNSSRRSAETEEFETYTIAGQTRVRTCSLVEGGYAGLLGEKKTKKSKADAEDEDLNVDGDDSAQFETDLVQMNMEDDDCPSPVNTKAPGAAATKNNTKGGSFIIDSLKARIKDLERSVASIIAYGHVFEICLGGYNTPLVSINCWHAHCEQCWMSTLGAKKLCPQCKVITCPGDLRRIYM